MNAIISPCGKYRYRLDRQVQPEGKVFAYFGINPSTADANLDDATVRKWRGFTQRNEGSRFIVGNIFSYRATDVRELGKIAAEDIKYIYNDNLHYIREIIGDADVLIPCWGSKNKLPKDLHQYIYKFAEFLDKFNKPMYTFGFTNSGDPKHPLMLGYETPLLEWENI